MTNGKDSRRDPRAKVLSMTVRYKSATVAEFIENHSYDVSRGGIFIKTPSPFPPGTLLKFEVRIAEEQKVMMGVGRVTWKRDVETGPDKPAGMGVKFIKLDDESTRLIGELVDSRESIEASFEEGARESGVKVSVPPPVPAPTASDPDKSMIAHTADILRSAVDATRSQPKKSEADEEDRATLPNSGPVPGVRKPSAPPRPHSKLPSPTPGAPVAGGSSGEHAGAKSGSPSNEAKAGGDPVASARVGAVEKPKPATEVAASAEKGVEGAAKAAQESAASKKKPISELVTTPPKRSHSGPATPTRKTNPLLWVILTVGAVLAGYYVFTQRQQGAEETPIDVPAPEPTQVAEAVPTEEEQPPQAPPQPSEAASAEASAEASAVAVPSAEPSAAPTVEAVEPAPTKPAPRPRPARPKAPKRPPAAEAPASGPPAALEPPAPEGPGAVPAPPPPAPPAPAPAPAPTAG